MELVSLCAVTMAAFNLYLLRVSAQLANAVKQAYSILEDVAKGDVTIEWDGKGIKVTAVKQ